jgi:hypothetical protein
MSSRTPWTSEELRQLDDLARRNLSLRVVALKLGRSAAAVDAKAAQLKIAVRRMKRRYRRKHSRAPGGSADGDDTVDPSHHEGLESA